MVMNDFLRITRKNIPALLLFLLLFPLIWIISGFYLIDQNEAAIPLLWGNPRQIKGPGIHFNLPYPFGEVLVVDIKKSEIITVGYKSIEYDGMDSNNLRGKFIRYTGNSQDTVFMDVNKFNQQFMTGDGNIISLEVEIHYSILHPDLWFFAYDNPRKLILSEARGLLTETIGSKPVEKIIVRDPQLENSLHQNLKKRLDIFQCGVELTAVSFKNITLPEDSVADAFRDVKSAEDDKVKRIEEARREASAILSKGKTESSEIMDKATVSAARTRASAQADINEFSKLLASLEEDPQFETRLYYESIEKILGRARRYVISPSDSLETVLIERKNE